MPCREHVSQLRHASDQLNALRVEVKIVVFDDDVMAKMYAAETNLKWPLLLDSDRQLYTSYGISRGSWLSIYNPVSIAKYIGLILTGRRPSKPGQDWRQMGGDILIDPQGIVRLHHISRGPHDRPTIQEILAIVNTNNGVATAK